MLRHTKNLKIMKVDVVQCGHFVNHSEETALRRIESELKKQSGNDQWVLMSNVTFMSDEIDIIAIGPPGIRLLEVKHWSDWNKNNKPDYVDPEAIKINGKCKRLSSLRKYVAELPFVQGVFLLTHEPSRIKKWLELKEVRTIPFHSLAQWRNVLDFEGKPVLTPDRVSQLAKIIAPNYGVKLDGSMRRMGEYVNLELLTPPNEKFHRIYKGQHASRRDRIILHLYDLSVPR